MSLSAESPGQPPDRLYLRNVLYFGVLHALPFGALASGVTQGSLVGLAVLYLVRTWFITAGYHCYFSHRAFRTGRCFQFLLAVGAQASGQGSALRWAAAHQYHHGHADREDDLHSPRRRGLLYAHIGWLFRTRYVEASRPRCEAFARYPEILWLDRYYWLPGAALAGATFLALGWPGLFVAYGGSTVLTCHATFSVNSLAHRFGTRRFATPDDSRNNWFVALILLGGGWHNNHHRFPRSARQGLRWWEIDVTYYVLALLGGLGLVWDLRGPLGIMGADARRSRERTPRRSTG